MNKIGGTNISSSPPSSTSPPTTLPAQRSARVPPDLPARAGWSAGGLRGGFLQGLRRWAVALPGRAALSELRRSEFAALTGALSNRPPP